MKSPQVQHRSVRSFDGTAIAYQVCGSGPPVIFSNGLGGNYSAWRYQYALLKDHYRIISWDYRGLFRSEKPARRETLSIRDQVRDLEAILATEEVDRALFLGWSMGVQVNFEFFRRHSEQFVGIIAINGTAGAPFKTVFGGRNLFEHIAPFGMFTVEHGGPLLRYVRLLPGGWRVTARLLQKIGILSSTINMDVANDLLDEFATMDFTLYAETMRYLGEHDATDLLHRVNVPTLVIAGGRDMYTPLATAKTIARAVPDARLVIIPKGTHYLALEYPREVNEELRTFIRSLGYGSLR
jgi:pimeloyl-ACP methyl ester carboxylesterase